MRDTFFALLITLGLTVGYFHYRNLDSHAPRFQTQSSRLAPSYGQRNSKLLLSQQRPQTGAKQHERTNHSEPLENSVFGENEGSSGAAVEAEGLPSIYSQAEFDGRALTPSEEIDASAKPETTPSLKRQKKMVHGVPVDLWLRSRKDSLSSRPLPPEYDSRLKVYVNCMEVKNGTLDPITEKQCDPLLARQTVAERKGVYR